MTGGVKYFLNRYKKLAIFSAWERDRSTWGFRSTWVPVDAWSKEPLWEGNHQSWLKRYSGSHHISLSAQITVACTILSGSPFISNHYYLVSKRIFLKELRKTLSVCHCRNVLLRNLKNFKEISHDVMTDLFFDRQIKSRIKTLLQMRLEPTPTSWIKRWMWVRLYLNPKIQATKN